VVTRGLILAFALVLSACAMDPQGGYRPVEQSGSAEGTSFNDANAQCWTQAYTLLGGNAMDSARSRAYDTCMHDRGWYDPRASAPPQPRTTTVPGSR
jgi:hypothetical protein